MDYAMYKHPRDISGGMNDSLGSLVHCPCNNKSMIIDEYFSLSAVDLLKMLNKVTLVNHVAYVNVTSRYRHSFYIDTFQ